MIFGKYVWSDLDINNIKNHFDLKTESGKLFLNELFETPSSDIKTLKERQIPSLLFKKLKDTSSLKNIENQLNKFKSNESFFEDVKTLNKENLSQIFWNNDSPFGNYANQSSSILDLFHNWKTLFIPGSTLIAPVLAILLPFTILQLMGKKPDIYEYLTIIKQTVRGSINIPSMFKSKHENDRLGFLFESLYVGGTIAFFMSGLYNTFSNALHLRNIGHEIKEYSNRIFNIVECFKSIHTSLKEIYHTIPFNKLINECNEIESEITSLLDKSGLGLFGTYYNNENILNNLKHFIGKIDVYYTISCMKHISFSNYITNEKPILKLKNIYHPSLNNPIKNDYVGEHNILTGPNRGGKSTYLKSVGLSVFLSQTIGIIFGDSCTITPFKMFETTLSPVDTLGRLSLFESEIEFAKSILHSKEDHTFVIMDEIFHSTNANDGFEASKIFLDQLYEKPHILSLISTHYHKLTEEFKHKIKPIQAYSTLDESKNVCYTYEIKDGISEISSVLEILKEHGLVKSS
jgi:hypothetical protein